MEAINFLTTISNHLPNHVGWPGVTHKNALNALELKQNGCYFANDISNVISYMKIMVFWCKFQWNLFPWLLINNKKSLVQIVAWRIAAAHHRKWDSVWGVHCSDTECHDLLMNMSRHPGHYRLPPQVYGMHTWARVFVFTHLLEMFPPPDILCE